MRPRRLALIPLAALVSVQARAPEFGVSGFVSGFKKKRDDFQAGEPPHIENRDVEPERRLPAPAGVPGGPGAGGAADVPFFGRPAWEDAANAAVRARYDAMYKSNGNLTAMQTCPLT